MIPIRFDVYLVDLNPTQGSEINKVRPCVIVSPDDLSPLSTILVAPMTSKGFDFPCRVACTFMDQSGLILLDQIRAVDKVRLRKKLGALDIATQQRLCATLQEFFSC
jgi:mRNA interferase MazF